MPDSDGRRLSSFALYLALAFSKLNFFIPKTLTILCTQIREQMVGGTFFMIWKIDFGLLAVGWARLWNKRFGPIMSNFWGQFFQLFVGKKNKKTPSKVAHNRPKPFFSQSSPAHSQQPKIDFSYHKNVPPSICSLNCANRI